MLVVLLASARAPAGTPAIFSHGFEDCTLGAAACPGFTMQTPSVPVAAGEELITCYYFHATNAGTLGLRRISSTGGAGLVSLVLYATVDAGGLPADRQPPGTLSPFECGFAQSNNTTAQRVYSAHAASETLAIPADDGAGQALAIEVAAGQPLFVQMHFLNTTDQPIASGMALTALGYPAGVPYVKTATYITYNGNLSLPPMSTSTASDNCAVPAGARFWWFSTETHKLATNATLSNGATMLVSSTDWQAPAISTFGPPAFYAFGAGERLTYACTYFNTNNFTVHSGESSNDEVCMGLSYYFPADRARFCFNNVGPL
jgi:hypothetical protein